ncbi:hypothetical protein GWK47_014304 [Chionoecetes opilio]|uniref:Fibronectin type-III domain-containing protein n=1 Tax=Chionoecetes opilio TaxID=41210 RepID=A0A8J5CNH1_CHIOP|nr:hypothetical protein GWK47_014304 [Chionoecetes opilio]
MFHRGKGRGGIGGERYEGGEGGVVVTGERGCTCHDAPAARSPDTKGQHVKENGKLDKTERVTAESCYNSTYLLVGPAYSQSHQRPQQFTPGKSTTDRILAFRVLVERRREFRQGMLAAHVDLKKAFDSMHRKGDRQDCNNYRGIALLSVPGKVLAHLLLTLIHSHLQQHQRPQQFTPGKSTTDRILAFRVLVERRLIFAESLEVLVMVLEALHEEAKPLEHEVSWLKNQVQVVSVKDIRRGGGQGGAHEACGWGKLMFLVESRELLASLGNTDITDLDFADDAAIFAESLEVLMMALEALYEEAKPLGLMAILCQTPVCSFNSGETCGTVTPCSETTTIISGGDFTAQHIEIVTGIVRHITWNNPPKDSSPCHKQNRRQIYPELEVDKPRTKSVEEEHQDVELCREEGAGNVEVWTEGGDGESYIVSSQFISNGSSVVDLVKVSSCESLGCTSLLASWDYLPVCSAVTSFEVGLDYYGEVYAVDVDATNITITGLPPSVSYKLCVRAVDDHGDYIDASCQTCYSPAAYVKNVQSWPSLGGPDP